jgi:hypothetical protein
LGEHRFHLRALLRVQPEAATLGYLPLGLRCEVQGHALLARVRRQNWQGDRERPSEAGAAVWRDIARIGSTENLAS